MSTSSAELLLDAEELRILADVMDSRDLVATRIPETIYYLYAQRKKES